MLRIVALGLLTAQGAGFSAPTPLAGSCAAGHRCSSISMEEPNKPGFDLSKIPLQSALTAFITVQSAYDLTNDIPALFGPDRDILRTAFDLGFLAYGSTTLLNQAGVVGPEDSAASATLAGSKCSVTLSVGREPGTWMPGEWAASGARLSLPMAISFSDETVDLGFPGEESMGGRYAKRLDCEGGSFVGPQGEVVVKATGGAWKASPSGRADGESLIRFFVDFPEGATRNDVTLPAGRVFFSCSCWDSEETCRQVLGSLPEDVMKVSGGVVLTKQGGLTIKRNDARNMFGALGDVNLILGRFSISAVEAVAAAVEIE